MVAGVFQWGPKPIVVTGFGGGHVCMERLNAAVGLKYLRIRRFMERINIGLVSLVGCTFNEVHGVTRDGANHNFGDNCWDLGSI